MTVSLLDVSTYLPGEPIGADYYAQFAESDDLRDNLMFRAPKFRHHVAEDETAIDMVERAAAGLIERHGHDAIANVDVLITHTQMPDMPFYGGGGGMAHRLGMKPNWVLDLHNGGCAAFVLGLQGGPPTARPPGQGQTALIAVAQNAAGQVFDQPTVRRKAQAAVPGDGAAVGLVTRVGQVADPRHRVPHLRRVRRRHDASLLDPPRKWWQPGTGEGCIGFTESKITKVLARGNRQVPEVSLRGLRPNRHASPRISTCSSPTSRTGCSCGTGARRWSCPRSATATPSTSAATCSPPASRSTSTAPSPTVSSRRVTW